MITARLRRSTISISPFYRALLWAVWTQRRRQDDDDEMPAEPVAPAGRHRPSLRHGRLKARSGGQTPVGLRPGLRGFLSVDECARDARLSRVISCPLEPGDRKQLARAFSSGSKSTNRSAFERAKDSARSDRRDLPRA